MPKPGTVLKLGREWTSGKRIGKGGFGQVFEVTGGDSPAVAKFIPKQPGAERELLFVDLSGTPNVIPIIDQGEHGRSWVLVMPKAGMSLADLLKSKGQLSVDEATPVVLDVCESLAALAGRVVHRDLKPDNILLLDGHWCLSDFGISRYAEASTSTDTHKWSMTPPYAAPEQWRFERATGAADVYALGVTIYEMLHGSRPFTGSSMEDFRDAHLHQQAPRFDAAGPIIEALIIDCLLKSPQARPTPAAIRERWQRQSQPATGGLASLQQANSVLAQQQAGAALAASIAASEADIARERREAAKQAYDRISTALRDAVSAAAPNATVLKDRNGGWSIALGNAKLLFDRFIEGPFNWAERTPPFTVDAVTSLAVTFPRNRYDFEGRSHSLWFGDIQEAGVFGWFETAFNDGAFSRTRHTIRPFALDPGQDAGRAFSAAIGEPFTLDRPFVRTSADDLDEFVSRWAEWFAAAFSGSLQSASRTPEHDPNGSWRRG